MADQEQEVKLLGLWASPYVRRAEWALKLKGIGYEYMEEDLQNKSGLLLKYNPVYKKVPVLVHGGQPIAESLIILEYIEETWGHHPLLPDDPYAKATARFWAKFINERLLEHFMAALLFTEGEEQEKEVKEVDVALEIIEGQLNKENKFLMGGEIRCGYLDLALGWLPHWSKAAEEVTGIRMFDSANYPLISEWTKRIHEELPVVSEHCPPKDELVSFYKKIRQNCLGSIK